MADKRSWIFFLVVFGASLIVTHADIKFSIPVGKFFTYELMRETFQNDFEPLTKLFAGRLFDDPMVFKCNLQNFPDLPEWLRFTQRHHYNNGFLYGTPTTPGKNIIEIYVVNKRSYETTRQTIIINVVPHKTLPYQAEFFLKLRNIEQVLPSTVQDDIKQDIHKLWGTDWLEMVNITNALDRGGRVPLPLPARFEGVYVKVGSEKYFSGCLLRLLTAEHQQECSQTPEMAAPGDCYVCGAAANCISWCKTELVGKTKAVAPPPVIMGPGILESEGEYDPPDSPPSRDFLPDYIVTVIVPFLLAIILCVLLAYIMCCRREGVEKRNALTPDIQLYHHLTIHDNGDELRSMANGRGITAPLSTLPMFNARTGARAAPLSDNIPLIMAQQEPYVDAPTKK